MNSKHDDNSGQFVHEPRQQDFPSKLKMHEFFTMQNLKACKNSIE